MLTKYSDMVFKIAYLRTQNRSDAEDVFQDVFVSYMQCGTDFSDEEHRRAWLIRVTVNTCKNLWKSAWRRHRAELNDDLEAEPIKTGELYELVAALPAKYRTAVHLHYYEDMKIDDIASALGVKANTVKSWLHRARLMLKGKLED
ncbi:MAG: RNA polymerase sigma factor [Oscillospiraceae bacterium]|nr:RNA polymerase sigma factor [Oscillospiraceae bacterium]